MSHLDSHRLCEWKVYPDTCGSGHFPNVLENSKPNEDGLYRWILKKADWESFQNECKKRQIQDSNNKNLKHFTKTLLVIATECIPKRQRVANRNKSWFDKNCHDIIRLR